MCGITGFFSAVASAENEARIQSMNLRMRHRGPDEDGFFDDGHVFLAMRRLSIIDLQGGSQPMQGRQGQHVVIFNGEIYNYKELRQELEGKGYIFHTQSDTETLLHGYDAWGMTGLLSRLNGMFGFCIYDRDSRKLYLARDRAGEKPIYFHQRSGFFCFASELQVLTSNRCVPLEIDQQALSLYFLHQFCPGPRTLLKEVYKLMPGQSLCYDLDQQTLHLADYWTGPCKSPPPASAGEYREQLRWLLKDSVQRRLQADVPVGAFLSGGLDSSINVGLIASLGHQGIETFSIGFEDDVYDESVYSQQVAEHFSSRHHHFLLNPSRLKELLPLVIDSMDEPVADAAAIPTWWLCHESRKTVKVALTGEGADELFAGYGYYQNLPQTQSRRGLLARLPRIGALWSQPQPSSPMPISGFPLTAELAEVESLFAEKVNLKQTMNQLQSSVMQRAPMLWDTPLQKAQYYDVQTWLADDLLMKVDKMSMGNSLEVRAPFLDHRLIEFALLLPDEQKISGAVGKKILRETYADLLPPAILSRPKHGFNLPMHRWLRQDLLELVQDTLSPQALQRSPFLNAETVENIKHQFFVKERNCERLVYSLFLFQQWWDKLGD